MKFETLMYDSYDYKKTLKKFEIGQGSRPCGAILYQKLEIFHIFGAAFPPACGD